MRILPKNATKCEFKESQQKTALEVLLEGVGKVVIFGSLK